MDNVAKRRIELDKEKAFGLVMSLSGD